MLSLVALIPILRAAPLINYLLHMVGHISILLTTIDIASLQLLLLLVLHNVVIARIDIESEVVTRLVRTVVSCIGGLFGDGGLIAAHAQRDHRRKVLLCARLFAALDLGHVEALLQDGIF